MKSITGIMATIFILLLLVPARSRHLGQSRTHHGHHHLSPSTSREVVKPNNYHWERRPMAKRKGPDTLQIAGSRLPDCSHACGSCSPCRLVMVNEDEIHYWRPRKGEEELEWHYGSDHVLSQLAQCFTNAMVGPRSWLGGLFNRSNNRPKLLDIPFSPLQEQRLQRLQERLLVPFDECRPDHQEALKALWYHAFPDVPLKSMISEQWKDMGWQGVNPSTDFRGCGYVSLENLLFFVRTYPEGGNRATWEYPFAVAGINVSFMLIQMLDLSSARPKCLPGVNFVKLLGEDEEAFDVLYCIAFNLMDAQWLAMHASYMEFNEVLQVTRTQLERELSLEDIRGIHDLPAYNLLYHQ
ncbi:hypothetical protein ACFE04_017343 [Oxalis oulophora]